MLTMAQINDWLTTWDPQLHHEVDERVGMMLEHIRRPTTRQVRLAYSEAMAAVSKEDSDARDHQAG